MSDVARVQRPTYKPQFLSVSLMPGLTISSVMIVNNPGDARSAFSVLKHAHWNGFTPADLVFPAFLFMIGVGTTIAHVEKEQSGHSHSSLLLAALWRATYLIAIGLCLDALFFHPWRHLLFFGVLQRVALCLACGSFLLAGARRPLPRRVAMLCGFTACLLGYWVLMRFVPVPGYGVPGQNIPLLDPAHNLDAWIDYRLFAGHLLHRAYDPNGLLSTIPATGTFIAGMLTGLWLMSGYTERQKALGLVAVGCVSLGVGGLWNSTFPINMQLWTSSYVLWAAGWTFFVLALLFTVADVLRVRGRGWAILLVFGTNAMASFIFASAVSTCFVSVPVDGENTVGLFYNNYFSAIRPKTVGSLLYALLFTAGCWALMHWFYRRKIALNI